jgi:enoyl-CoA hydratase/carnithine racemase
VTDTTAPSATDVLLAERRGPVLVLTLNRPDRLNAWNDALEDAYYGALRDADADPEIRAIVVTGAGRGFCAGADMEDLATIGTEGAALPQRPLPRHFPLSIRKPLIAAINGAAAGLGLVEALYCDVRFSTPTAKLTTAFARRGLVAEYGLSWLLPRLVGPSRALDMLLSARVVLGEDALAMGLVDRVVEPERLVDEAVAYAQDLAANCSPWSMATIKGQVQRHLDTDFATAVADTDRLMAESFSRPDVIEGVSSYLEQRPPAFPPLDPRS